MKVADMHCDTIAEIFYAKAEGKECGLAENHLHIDLEKMKQGDYLVQNFAIFANIRKYDNPYEHCLELIDLFHKEIELNKDKIAVAYNYDTIMSNRAAGKMSAILTVEEGAVTNCSLENLSHLYQLGARMVTLTWNYANGIGYPSFEYVEGIKPDFKTPDTKNGLTEFGVEFIREMDRLGMIIDVSHLSDAGFYQVLKNTTKPFAASHSNARGVCNHVRNLSDDMIRKLAERGGVMGINYCPSFLREVEEEKDAVGTIAEIAAHVKYIINVGGYECIGLGSDFDGIPTHSELPDASYLPRLAERLSKEGIGQHEIEAIFHKNVLRLYQEVLR